MRSDKFFSLKICCYVYESKLKVLDILITSETKTGDTFPDNQFSIEGFSTPYRLDLGSNNGGIYLYA